MKQLFLLFAVILGHSSICSAQFYVSTLAGNGTAGGVNGTGSAATFNGPTGITLVSGNVFIADRTNNLIRKITPAGVVTTFAGSGSPGLVNGTGTSASFSGPNGLCADASGNIYVADAGNHVIRKITPAGVVSTYAGTTSGFADGPATSAQFNTPVSVIGDLSGNIYVSDQTNQRIRKITSAGVVSTIAGSGTAGFVNGTGTAASFNSPSGISFNTITSDLFVADAGNNCIRRITTASVVSTFAGSAVAGSNDGIGINAGFTGPTGIHVAPSFTNSSQFWIYVADNGNNLIREINTTTGMVTTITGLAGQGFVDGTSSVAKFNSPYDLRFSNNAIYVTDRQNQRIRRIDPCPTANFPINATSSTTVCSGSSTTLSAIGNNTIQWYTTLTGTTAVATGSDYITSNTLTPGTYTLFAEDVSMCTNTGTAGLRTSFEFTVVCCNIPNNPSNTTPASNATVCAGNATTLSATSTGSISWYTGASGGTALSSGTNFVTSNTLSPGTYTVYSEATSSCSISAFRTAVIFQVVCCGAPNAPSNVTPVSDMTVCAGNSTTLSVTGIGTVNWYSMSSGGVSIATGTNYITLGILPAGVYTVYAEAATTCSVSASRTPITFTVIQCCFAPDPPQNTTPVANMQVCVGMSAILTATSNGAISWFNSSSGGSAISTGTLYTTSNALPVGVFTYFAESASTCSVNPLRTAVSFTVIDCEVLGLESQQNKTNGTRVYPNPTQDIIFIASSSESNKIIELTDVSGRILLRVNSSDKFIRMDLTTVVEGIYYLRINTDKVVQVTKIVKQ